MHNIRVTSAVPFSDAEVPEGLVLPEAMLALADLVPFEQVIVTKIGGDNWMNRMYTYVLPGDTEEVEARGSVAHLLGSGDVCCAISRTTLDQSQYRDHVGESAGLPLIDVRFYPDDARTNDYGTVKVQLESGGNSRRVDAIPDELVERRRELPRTVLSNLLTGLQIQEVERRGCIEMSAELPIEYMRRAGFCVNQSIFVYNCSRGGASAESYVVPSLTKKTIGISGALSAVADVGDRIAEAAYVSTTERFTPTICDLRREPVLTA
ncbi:aspartate 1-decarboxylase [Amycolatopsis anabasis]|uniref:aspartate 1-decarboxylase n=1 Tax=Amycolatopsis anabasis TaxID=1840409 RepID=UPI001C5557C5|nr:aspartate 1-decarboxylase [Amycolatopsis anabasis]